MAIMEAFGIALSRRNIPWVSRVVVQLVGASLVQRVEVETLGQRECLGRHGKNHVADSGDAMLF